MTGTDKKNKLPVQTQRIVNGINLMFAGIGEILSAMEPDMAKAVQALANTTAASPGDPNDYEEILGVDDLPEKTVTLRCMNDLMRNVLDRFGEDIKTTPADDGFFHAKVTVVPSSTFFGWVMQYKGGILIEKPADVKRRYEEMMTVILAKQSEL